MKRHYRIIRSSSGTVYCEDVVPGQKIPTEVEHQVYHSPTGYEYGYAGSGPSDLARSIMWHHLGHRAEPALYMAFKDDFIVPLDGAQTQHTIPYEEVEEWLRKTGWR